MYSSAASPIFSPCLQQQHRADASCPRGAFIPSQTVKRHRPHLFDDNLCLSQGPVTFADTLHSKEAVIVVERRRRTARW